MISELSLGILPSTACQFQELIDDVHKNSISSKKENRSRHVPITFTPPEFWKTLERNSTLDAAYQQELYKFRKYNYDILETRSRLPVFKKKDDILQAVENNPVVVITGETGCGKTTQIPQFILDDYIEKGKGSVCKILCCQPRQISAAGVAERVAKERRERCGGKYSTTGYQIRFDNRSPRNCGSILFCTIGILQNFLAKERTLSFCSHIIIDEVHERNLYVDFIITVARELLKSNRGNNLHLILMSASVKPESFSEYFDNCPITKIPGRTYPVEKYMLEDVFEFTKFQPTVTSQSILKNSKAVTEDFISKITDKYSPQTIDRLRKWDEVLDCDLVISLLKYICREENKGAILIFFPGWDEIHQLRDLIYEDDMFNNGSYKIVLLHSRIPIVNQKEVFDPPPRGTRKIIISTNIAEASVTIDDVAYVIDCGLVKMSIFDVNTAIESLEACWISKSSAQQRRGRAGRTKSGKCYHLFTSHRESLLEEFQPPEMVHSSLDDISLKIKLFDLCDIKNFFLKVMDKPHPKAIELAIALLRTSDCIDANEALTPLGSAVAQLPLTPQLGKMILFGAIFSCLHPILTIAAVLDYEDPFFMPKERRTFAKSAKEKLANNSMSDHITFARAYDEWKASRAKKNYCEDNFLLDNIMVMISKLRNHFCTYLYRLGFVRENRPEFGDSNKNSREEELIKAIVCAGLYPNIAVVDTTLNDKRYYTREHRVRLIPWSILSICPEFTGRWLVYYKRVKTWKLNLYDASVVRPISIFLFGAKLEENITSKAITLDGWIEIRSRSESLQLLREIRETFLTIINKIIMEWKIINWDWTNAETKFIRAITEHICNKRVDHESIRNSD